MKSKEKILEKAIKLFSKKPYGEVTIEDIADRAGVSKGGLFHHFSSKRELAEEALSRELERWTEEVLSKVSDLPSPEEKLKAILDGYFDYFLENPKFIRFFLEVYEKSLEKEGVEEKWEDFYHRYFGYLEKVFKEAGITNPRAKGQLLCAILDGLPFQVLITPKAVDREEIKREILEVFLKDSKEDH